MEHGTQWAGRGQSSARMLPANLLTPASTHSPSSVFSSFFSFLASPPPERKVHPHIHVRFWLAAGLFWKLLFEAHFQLTVLWPQSRTFAPFESGLSVHRHTEPNLHHTGGVKGITMGQCKKRENETTQKQHKNSTERRRERGGRYRGKKQNTRVHKCRKL